MNQNHWANQPERGNRLALWLTTQIVRYLPPWLLPIAVSIISRYYYHTSPRARRNITRYQQRLQRTTLGLQLPKHAVYRQIRSFAEAIADRFAVWQHRLTYRDLTVHDPDNLYQRIDHPEAGARGEILLCSHHGNMEICRALVAHHRHFALNILVHHKHAEAYNRALKKAGADDIRMIQVSELDAAVMLELQNRINRGEWLAIAADRLPVRGEKTVRISFLGDEARIAQGPWLLAGLLQARINTLFCRKQNGRYHLYLADFAAGIHWQKHSRTAIIQAAASRYAALLERECRQAPLQWYNFYDFWNDDEKQPPHP